MRHLRDDLYHLSSGPFTQRSIVLPQSPAPKVWAQANIGRPSFEAAHLADILHSHHSVQGAVSIVAIKHRSEIWRCVKLLAVLYLSK